VAEGAQRELLPSTLLRRNLFGMMRISRDVICQECGTNIRFNSLNCSIC
jgi:hypothetical protein